ncbi:hypothetical protein A7K93_06315 [Candidatus Methylacidiphilum fumarolicum]|nr:hypothetical protein A7K73_07840 [Candidatus Methylacidiphilum fumarolicum]TFE73477.1 hypothetical protein A7K93_06315 [Candidatus Methylacidiphilum fumarolicum]TFE74356.1 hypothetical protein A7K72_04185 [Candidatus Methylacidiphilum fumarolicum]TFE76907.1 hypothetical protein A7D33_07380 [Candidatus Methylacidiphilum fumarolicum]
MGERSSARWRRRLIRKELSAEKDDGFGLRQSEKAGETGSAKSLVELGEVGRTLRSFWGDNL